MANRPSRFVIYGKLFLSAMWKTFIIIVFIANVFYGQAKGNILAMFKDFKSFLSYSVSIGFTLGFVFVSILIFVAILLFTIWRKKRRIHNPTQIKKVLNKQVEFSMPIIKEGKGIKNKIKKIIKNLNKEYSICAIKVLDRSNSTPLVLTVISAYAGEGKSITALALANSLSSYSKKALVIDGDYWRPLLHKYYGTKLVARNAQLNNAVTSEVSPFLHFLAAKRIKKPCNQDMQDLVNFILAQKNTINWDYIIVDTPPILQISEVEILLPIIDICFWVISKGLLRSSIEAVVHRLKKFNEKIDKNDEKLFVIFNTISSITAKVAATSYLSFEYGAYSSLPYDFPYDFTYNYQ